MTSVGRAPRTLSAVTALLLLTGCGADGPEPVREGSYRFLAGSAGSRSHEPASLVIEDGTLTLTTPAGETRLALGAEAEDTRLCPGGGSGRPVHLGGPVSVGGVDLATPAVFGDCGRVSPARVTLVDLDSAADALPAFSRWVEFCVGTDPDCPAA